MVFQESSIKLTKTCLARKSSQNAHGSPVERVIMCDVAAILVVRSHQLMCELKFHPIHCWLNPIFCWLNDMPDFDGYKPIIESLQTKYRILAATIQASASLLLKLPFWRVK